MVARDSKFRIVAKEIHDVPHDVHVAAQLFCPFALPYANRTADQDIESNST